MVYSQRLKTVLMSEALVIIPTYNEIENIEKMVNAVFSLPAEFDLLIIDDNSPDGTAIKIKELQSKFSGKLHLLERSGKLGLGTAYIAGFKWGIENRFEYIFEMDADFSHNPADLLRLYESCKKGADLTIGSRYKSGVNVVNWPMGRVLMSYFASKYVRFITGLPVHDTKAIDLDMVRFKGYAFQIEMKFTAWKMGFKINEIPIVFTDRKEGKSKMSGGIFNEAFWGVIKLKFSSFFKKYKKVDNEIALN
jgi:dolichol-phosphate mannosyltransferase